MDEKKNCYCKSSVCIFTMQVFVYRSSSSFFYLLLHFFSENCSFANEHPHESRKKANHSNHFYEWLIHPSRFLVTLMQYPTFFSFFFSLQVPYCNNYYLFTTGAYKNYYLLTNDIFRIFFLLATL